MEIVEIIIIIAVALGFGFLFSKEKRNEKETKELAEEVGRHRSAIEGGRRRVDGLVEEREVKKSEITEDVANLGAADLVERYRARNRPDYDDNLK